MITSILPKRTPKFNNASVFENARQIPLLEVINKYSPHTKLIHRGNRWSGLCPLHNDSSPSFIIYPDGRFKCFGCLATGSGIDFVSQLLNIAPLEAAKQICHDFGLQVDDTPLSCEARKRRAKRQLELELAKAFEQLVENQYQRLALIVRSIERALRSESWEDFTNIVHALPEIEYYMETLRTGKDSEKLELIRSGRLRRWLP